MSKVDLLIVRNRNKQKLHSAFKQPVNVVRFGLNEGLHHCLMKTRICYFLMKLGVSFVTEAKFKNMRRADIYVLDKDKAIEILCSEKVSNLDLKACGYPCDIVGVRVEDKVDVDVVEKLIN